MSRTEGISLPRLPVQHARATSPRAIQPHPAASDQHRRAISEPSYTAFVGTPRQDVPQHIYRDAAMFDDVFDKKGQLLLSRNTPKISSPLNTLGYSSLHDPHCRKLFLKNKQLRSHLMHLGLITEDLKVVATTAEQRQKIRAHELLERKEQLFQKLESHEKKRIDKLQRSPHVPVRYQENLQKAEERRERAEKIQALKMEKLMKAEEEKCAMEKKRQDERRKKLKAAMEEATLMDQARRNAARAQQEMAEALAYQKQYGKYGQRMAAWHRDADRIHNQMVAMERKRRVQTQHVKDQSYSTEGSIIASSHDSPMNAQSSPSVATPTLPNIISDHSHHHTPDQSTNEITAGIEVEQIDGQPATNLVPISPKIEEAHYTTQTEKDSTSEIVTSPGEEKVVNDDEISEKVQDLDISNSGNKVPTGKEVQEDEGQSEEVEVQGSDEEAPPISKETEEVIALDPQQGMEQLTQILEDAFSREDLDGSGYISTDNFIKVLISRDIGLQLNESEILYLAEQSNIYKDGNIPILEVVPQLPGVLLALYHQRAEQSLAIYGVYPEEQWCELRPHGDKGGACYLHKLTGAMQIGGRPDDFRPFLKDDVFEEAIIDFFETADIDKDGVIDYNDFSSLLTVSTLDSKQTEELLIHYANATSQTQGLMTMEDFAPIARLLLLMVYRNAYPGEAEWIELESSKFGIFSFNIWTGSIHLASPSLPPSSRRTGMLPSSLVREEVDGARKKKKHSRRVSWSDGASPIDQPSHTAPPPLRRRQSKEPSRESSHRQEPSHPGTEPIDTGTG